MIKSSMIRSIKYSPLFLVLFVLSCRAPKEVEISKLPRVKDEVLMQVLDSMLVQNIDFFYSKVSTKFEDSTQSNSFKTSIRMKNDSALNATITFANIPIINALLTRDSVFVSNRKDKCYSKQSLEYLKKNFGVTFTADNVEELVMGLPVGYESEHKYHQIDREELYLLSSHKKREIKRNEKKEEREIITYYGISPDLKRLDQVIIDSPDDSTIIQIDYKKRELVQDFLAPDEVEVLITTPKKVIKISLEYRKTRVNEAETIYFTIPEEYEECGEE